MRTLFAALVLDVVVGEPPESFHPVVWMGRLLAWFEARAPHNEWARFVYGTAVAVSLPLTWGLAARALEVAAPWPLQAIAFKCTFAGRSLRQAVQRVEQSLASGESDRARAHLSWLVSRPTQQLDDDLVAAAAIESLAENFVDSWVAPLLAYAVSGLGGAYAYRAANTADAMWGYHSAEFEWLGKPAARLDDVLNWLPSRVGALLLLTVGHRPGGAVRVWLRDARRTESPNAGQSMAAAAGQLGVRLEKVGHYRLNADARPPNVDDVGEALRLVARGMVLAGVIALIVRKVLHP